MAPNDRIQGQVEDSEIDRASYDECDGKVARMPWLTEILVELISKELALLVNRRFTLDRVAHGRSQVVNREYTSLVSSPDVSCDVQKEPYLYCQVTF
jgi:hypothetical protein